jgi:hypothetical protein
MRTHLVMTHRIFSMREELNLQQRSICGLAEMTLVASHGTGTDWWCSVEVQVVDVEV